MIMRLWLVAGTVLIGVAWYLTVSMSPADHQGAARSAIGDYRTAGVMPAAGALTMSKEIGHDVFEVPKEDAEHMGDQPMAGMDHGAMPGMTGGKAPPVDHSQMPGMTTQKAPAADHGKMPGMTAEKAPAGDHGTMPGMTTQKAPAMDHSRMPGMTTQTAPDADRGKMPEMTGEKMPAGEQEMPGMTPEKTPSMDHSQMPGMTAEKAPAVDHGKMPGMTGATGRVAESEGGHGGGGEGLAIVKPGSAMEIGRTVEIRMTEWGYAPASITVKEGEVVRLAVVNAGSTPHEFMLMTGPAMNAVGYRANRADWNLTEHEAIYEQPLIMPGDRFELVVKIEKPGMWMFMCMFPYHMQLGMMGGIATEGMEGMSMGGMKM